MAKPALFGAFLLWPISPGMTPCKCSPQPKRAPSSYLEPLAAIAMGAWLLQERITLISLLGGLVIIGVYLVNHRRS
ncbi:MAG: hypothetical protein ACK8QZ_06710 [Anaerolineales bacterium]